MRRLLALLLALALLAGCGPRQRDSAPAPEPLLPAHLAGRSGYLTPGGAPALPFRYADARRFSEGRAVVAEDPAEGPRLYGVIDADGRALVPPRYAELGDYAGGRARFRLDTPAGPRYGFLDATGAVVIPARYVLATDFSEGLAGVREPGGQDAASGYIDPAGAWVIALPRAARELGAFAEGLAVVVYSPLDSRVIDRRGRERFASKERLGERVGDGRVTTFSSDGERYRYLDRDGRPAFAQEFDFAGDFHGGLARVKPAGAARFGYLDAAGALRVPAVFRQAGDFDDGPQPLAPVLPEQRWGYIDAAGRLAIAPRFVWAGSFRGEWAEVETELGPNLVNRRGELLWDPSGRPVEDWEAASLAGLVGVEVLELAGERRVRTGALLGVHASLAAAVAAGRLAPGPELLLAGENRFALFALDGPPPGADARRGDPLLQGWQVSVLEADAFLEALPAGPDSLRLARADAATLGALLLARRELPPRQAMDVYAALPARVQALGDGRLHRYPLLLDTAAPPPELAEAVAPLPVQDDDGAWRLVTLGGEPASPQRYQALGALRDGRRPYAQGGRWGYLDAAGRELTPPRWTWADAFSEGLAAASRDSVAIGFIDSTGAFAIPPRFRGVDAFSEGLCMAVTDSLGGYIDRAGEWVIPPRFTWSGRFSEGLAAATVDGRAVGFVDRSGEFVLPPRWQYAGDFADGLAPVTRNGRVGYLNRAGELVIPCRYEEGMPFSEGLAAVASAGRVGYVDATGAERLPTRYTAGTPFEHGVALVVDGGRLLVIDTEGRALWRSPTE
ncbi:MAG: WG repeat-containing protein [Candidatus Latescibacteria bacterium]|nr:WG repeat-containing protein [Candidatus Latescibacterota bacterium]